MARSPGFGSATSYFRPIKTRFRFGSGLSSLTSQSVATRRFILQKARHHPLTGSDFCRHTVSGLFHSAPAVLFTFPSRYWFTIAHSFIFSLGGWSRLLPTRFLVSRRTQDPIRLRSDFDYRAFTFFGRAFDPVLLSSLLPYHGPSTPVLGPVWAFSLSLAATQGITVVFFSSGYLDVSVRRVPLLQAMYSPADDTHVSAGFPHSDTSASSLPLTSRSFFAVWRVLLQFRVARHSPYALPYLISGSRVFLRCSFFKNCFLLFSQFILQLTF